MHRLLHPPLDSGVRVLDRLDALLARRQVVERAKHVLPDPIVETLVESHRELVRRLVATETVRSSAGEEISAGIHGEFVEQLLQVHGRSVGGYAGNEFLHIRLELVDRRDLRLLELRA